MTYLPNADTIRKYVISGNNTIPGASTVHFDEIAKVVVENDGLLKKLSYQWSREKLERNLEMCIRDRI